MGRSGGGVGRSLTIPGSRPQSPGTRRPGLAPAPSPAPSPAPRSRCWSWWWLAWAVGSGVRIRAREVGERGDVGGLQLVLRRAVKAGDPVARRRPVGAPGPPNKANAGETPGRKAFCVSARGDGAVGRRRGSLPHHPRFTVPIPRHPPARPGTGTFPGSIPGTAVAVLVLVVAGLGGRQVV